MFLITHGTEWSVLCWCAIKQLFTHLLILFANIPDEAYVSHFGDIWTSVCLKLLAQCSNKSTAFIQVGTFESLNFISVADMDYVYPSVLLCCWLGDRKGIQPVKVLPQQLPGVYFSNLTWSNSGKMAQLNQINPDVDYVIALYFPGLLLRYT